VSCPLCRQRKGKRHCPARGEAICAHCCGTKRRVAIACPDDCVYLTGGHAGAWEGRETERVRDMRRVAPQLQRLSEAQLQLLLVALVGITGIRARHALTDALVAQALAAVRRTVETRRKGVLYEHAAEDLRAQALVHEVQELFQSKDAAGRVVTPDDADLQAALEALEAALEATRRERAGPSAFLDTAARLAARLGAPPAAASPRPPGPLILEP